MSNIRSIERVARTLRDMRAVHPPDAPGATIVMGLADDGPGAMTFSGCDLDRDRAFQCYAGEAAEFMAQNDRRVAGLSGARPHDALSAFDAQLNGPPLHWIRASAVISGKLVSVPAETCCYLPGSSHLDISTGCAAGSTMAGAVQHALAELIERDAARRWWRGDHAARFLDPTHPALAVAMQWLDQARAGNPDRSAILLDIGGQAPIPVVAAVSFRADGSGCVMGTAAHPQLARAAVGAFRELVQMEFGLQLAQWKMRERGPTALAQPDLRHLFRAQSLDPGHAAFQPGGRSPWQDERDHASDDLNAIVDKLAAANEEILVVRLSDDPFLPVMRVLSPNKPIARRAEPLTYSDNHWKHHGNIDLY